MAIPLQHTRIALAQSNFTVGDVEGNAKKILALSQSAKALGASVLVTPEMALSGYPPEDLLLRPSFIDTCTKQLHWLKEQARDIMLIVGHPARTEGQTYNQASVLYQGKIVGSYNKIHLPNDAVFDECRYFKPGVEPFIVDINGLSVGILICEDIWRNGPAQMAKAKGAEILVVLNASPFHLEKHHTAWILQEISFAKQTFPWSLSTLSVARTNWFSMALLLHWISMVSLWCNYLSFAKGWVLLT